MNIQDAFQQAADTLNTQDRGDGTHIGGLPAGIALRMTREGVSELRLDALLADDCDAPTARRLLEACLNGVETGDARMALTPKGRAVLTRRIRVDTLETDTLDTALAQFTAYAAYWTAGPGRGVLDVPANDGPPLPGAENEIIMRV
ncbi:type III secretion system chaperone [Marivita sp. S0852]|uniref:type III secretion system chaperone n=1 Tax=Marivita sp. S0852 TaxID=3373893 RepID=UPI0039823CFA